MKATSSYRTGDFKWKLAFWITSTAILGLLAFGTAVQVDFVEPEMPLSQAIGSLDWGRVATGLRQTESQAVLGVSLATLIIFTVSRSWKLRAGALAAGFLMPVYMEGIVMLGVAAISPLMTTMMLAGRVDGEFYGEDMPKLAAAGLWMLLCLVYGIREILLVLKQRRHREAGTMKLIVTPRP
ncbi:MAG: hypothetical protein EOP85_17100 [Verrucomicrobiaceae bacterium]|nr:MAG: hypothetical protein EOP85_17100 [Verrucomicrobiaceae bacterium]